jgi:cytochrome c-type biogenesis protein CcmH
MITFWILAVAMVVFSMFFLLRPLFLDSNKADVDRTAQNVAITKERLHELKLELEQGRITEDEYEQSKEELEQALLNDVEVTQVKSDSIKDQGYARYVRYSRYALVLFVPVFALGTYAYLGQPVLIEGLKTHTAVASVDSETNNEKQQPSVEQMTEKLAERLKQQPDNAEGWYMLGRSYMSLNKYNDAAVALEKANQLLPDNPFVMLQYADALTMTLGGQISGKPFELIKRAVELKPDDVTGLWLLGMGYEEQGEYQKAISYWTLLVSLLKDDKSINEVQNLIRQAKNKAGISITSNESGVNQQVVPAEKKSTIELKLNVSIAKDKLKSLSMNDTVFIFAKATRGPPMPLAVVRKQVKDLPVDVTLDDSMAMIPSMKLSNFKKVTIVARISKSGSPKAQSGDLQSAARVVATDIKEKVELIINQLAP